MGRQPFMPRKPIDALDRRARVLPFYAKGNHVFASTPIARGRERASTSPMLERDSRSPPRTKECRALCVHRRGRLAQAGTPRFAYVGLSALSVLALAANTIVDGRCADPYLTGETRDAPVPGTKLSTRVTPGESE